MTRWHSIVRMAGAALLVAMTMATAAARAQTRADSIARQQEEKAAHLVPYTPNRAEVFLEQLEQGKWFLGVPRGWYLGLGSIFPGGGLAGGGGYRHYIGYDSYVDAGALVSIRGDRRVQVTGRTPDHLGGRLDITGTLSWIDGNDRPFYGLGIQSIPDGLATYRLNRAFAEGAAVLRPARWLRLRLDGGLDDYRQRPSTGSRVSIEQVYTRDTTPQIGGHPLYLRGEASAAIGRIDSVGYGRRGGFARVAYEEFNPLRDNGGTFGFIRAGVVQHVPIMRETWVLSARAATESVVRKSDVVPFFLMPSLGGSTSLRAYALERFRDRHTLLLSGELRWFPSRLGLDMAVFADAGTVAPVRTGLTLDSMKTGYGLGVRFHTPTSTVLRFDIARGQEGLRFVVATSSPF